MPAPDALKAKVLELLDEAYDSDGQAIARVDLKPSTPPRWYGEGEPPEPPDHLTLKVRVDATGAERILLDILARSGAWWPE